MATFSRIKEWVSNEVLTAADLNAEFDNIIDNITPTGIEDASANVAAMQATTDPGGVGTESLATSLLGEIQRLRFVLKRMIGSGQWYSAPTGTLQAGGIDTDALADGAVETAKIKNGAVTPAKRSALGQQVSSSSGSFSTTSTTYVDVTNLSVTITTTGRPVEIRLISDGSAGGGPAEGSYLRVITTGVIGSVNDSTSCTFKILRGASDVAFHSLQVFGSTTSGGSIGISSPSSVISHTDTPAAGTYTYKLQVKTASGAAKTAYIENTKLMVFEL